MTLPFVEAPVGAGAIASAEAIAVADITNPTELGSVTGTVVGERRTAYQVVANDNLYTSYYWDSADGTGASSPYVVAGSSGFWIAGGGRYTNSAFSLRSTLLVSGAATLSSTLGVTGTSTMAAINASGDIASTSNNITLTRGTAGGTVISAKNNDTTASTSVEVSVIGTTTGGASRNAIRVIYQPAQAGGNAAYLLQSGKVSGLLFEGASTVINQREGGPLVFGVNDTEVARLTTTGLAVTGLATISSTLGVTGVASVTNTTDASDWAHASIVASGGVAMAKNLWIGTDSTAGIAQYLNCAAANGAFIKYLSASTLRWQMGRVGSTHDWRIEGYDSGGSLTDIPLTIANAAGGAFTIVRPITATSTLAVTSNAGIGGAVSSLAVVQVGATNPLSGVIQIGGFVNMTGTSAGTSALRGAQFSLATAAASYTCTEATAFLCGAIAKGASSTITRATSAWLDPQSNGTNNCGLLIGTGVTYTGNWAIRSESTNASTLAGALSVTDATASTTTGTGAVVISGGLGVGGRGNFGGEVKATASTNSSQFILSDAATNTAPSAVQFAHLSSGTPAATFGVSFDTLLHSSNNTQRVAMSAVSTWVVATDASRTARTQFYALDTGFRECIRIEASGSAPMVGLYGGSAVAQYATTGTATGFVAGAGTAVTHLSTFTGNTGATAYTIGDIVRALKLLSAIAS